MSTPQKRPYVRPRVGHSVLRSLWYLFAFAGILVVAFLLPRNPQPLVAVDGSWDLQSERTVSDIPAGTMQFLATGGRYAFSFQASQPEGATGFEMGELREEDGELLMEPTERTSRDVAGNWHRTVPPPRTLAVRVDDDRLVLSDSGGATLDGRRRESPY